MIAHGDKEIEPQCRALSAATVQYGTHGAHLYLHCTRALESIAAPDDQRQVVRAQMSVALWGVGVRKFGGRKDRGHGN